MKQYQYKMVADSLFLDEKFESTLLEILNKEGKDGWLLISTQYGFIMVREIPEAL